MEKKKRIIIALSGGVDSSVAALLLKKAKHEVIALFMRNWHDEKLTIGNECPWLTDSHDALQIAEQLNIPFKIIDLSKEYKKRVVDYMINEYEKGFTPNPDILCNKEIKFDVFLKYAMNLKADFIATGHYCQKEIGPNDTHSLIQAKDKLKDQTYFLCQVNREKLKKIIFPIGHLTKKEVRKIAQENNLITANKKDSQGLCFVGKIKLPIFLKQKLKNKKGDIIEIPHNSYLYSKKPNVGDAIQYSPEDGKKIGEHHGAHYFTIGQRKGLTIGGKKAPLFVIETDVQKNIIYVGMGQKHSGLFRQNLKININNVHWLLKSTTIKKQEKKKFLVRIRHRQKLQDAYIYMDNVYLYILFQKPQRGISKGQFAAWYTNNKLIGSGPIE